MAAAGVVVDSKQGEIFHSHRMALLMIISEKENELEIPECYFTCQVGMSTVCEILTSVVTFIIQCGS